MADERHPSTLVEVLQGLGNGLHELSRSPAFAALVEAELSYKAKKERSEYPAALHVQDDGTIFVEGFEEPIDLLRLRRTIGNAAKSLTKYSDWTAGGERGMGTATARNYLVRTTASMNALAGVLKSDEVYSPFWDAAESMQSKWISNAVEGEDTVIVFHEQGQERLALTLAEVYRRVKTLKNNMANPINTHYTREDIEAVVSHLEAILLHISENADIKTIKTNGEQDV